MNRLNESHLIPQGIHPSPSDLLEVNYVLQIYSIWRAFTTESNDMNYKPINMGLKFYGTVMHHFKNSNMGGLWTVLRW